MIRSWEIFSADQIAVGASDHHTVMDLIGACRGQRDEQILNLRLNGATQADIAEEVGFTQSSVSRRLAGMLERAHSKLDELSVRMRDRSHNLSAPPEEIPPVVGLRFAKHTPGHRDCCRAA